MVKSAPAPEGHDGVPIHRRRVLDSGSRPVPHRGPVARWLLHGQETAPQEHVEGPYERDVSTVSRHPWWQVVCLTGVDYFSSLGYAPGIAAVAAGYLSPLATLVLVVVTLFGALPMYRRVAGESPHGDGSVSMLERLLPWWQGKLFVLCLIGFVSTGFVITITLSAADAAAHVLENPAGHGLHGHAVLVTLFLVVLLGAVFLKGFSEAIGVAVVLVVVYLALNLVVIGRSLIRIVEHPALIDHWHNALTRAHPGNPLLLLVLAVGLFPKLALGLSGFETGVLVMPLIRGDPDDTYAKPKGRIRNARRLLTTAAAIMSVLLLTSAFVTTLLIPQRAFLEGGPASGRALAYLAHGEFGTGFGTLYDISTICILWFAGASAMAGLLNIVPRYLPRYGMAPDWARATRPLTLLVTLICVVVTVIFRASVDAQADAYATGVLAVMTSAAIAVAMSVRRTGGKWQIAGFVVIVCVFVYTFLNTILRQPDGIRIALCFITGIIVISLASRVWRSTELRVTKVVLDETAQRFIQEAGDGPIRIIANHPDERNGREYLLKEREQREDNHIPPGDPVVFLEVSVSDASEFAPVLQVTGTEVEGFRVLRAQSPAVPNAIAAIALHIRDITHRRPHLYFGWAEGNPFRHLAQYILFGEGDIAPVTREVLRQAEHNPKKRPAIHVG